MATNTSVLECPLCTFSVLPSDNYILQLHFEQVHEENSPFRIENDPEPLPPPLPARPSATRDTPSDSEDDEVNRSVLCPEVDCGEVVLLSDFNEHLDLHAAATLSFDETTGQYHSHSSANMKASTSTTNRKDQSKEPSFLEHDSGFASSEGRRRHGDDSRKLKKKPARHESGSEKSTLSRSIASFNPFTKFNKAVKPSQSSARLGRAELGPHAWEDRMPKWLHDQLEKGPKVTLVNRLGRDGRLIKHENVQNETPGILPILAQLSAVDRSVKVAYYCHPSTIHIGKTPREGGFCGYRNIQMLASYIQGAHAQGHEEFPGRTPGILKLQDLIERAWDKGINSIGRQQTGGIRDTRKYIGTPEAQALFLSSEIDCAVEMFCDAPDGSIEAHEQLLYAVESYFSQAAVKDDHSKVFKTLLPPIYLQQPGHSVTIVGFERRKDGSSNLVTFDPMYHTSPAMHGLLGRRHIRTPRPEVLHAYRRPARALRKHAAFEILMLTAHPPLFPAWDVLRQFPDCRYLYAFFRSKTLGYDVYPEDHFLRNFPWQQYGGLWIVDEARFARADKMNPLTAQALRRITGEGASVTSSMFSASEGSSSFNTTGTTVHHASAQLATSIPGMRSGSSSQCSSYISNLDGQHSAGEIQISNPMDPVLNMIGMHIDQQKAMQKFMQPTLTLQVPQTMPGHQDPGFPTPESPSSAARRFFPSPVSESSANDQAATPRVGSPMSVDGSDMCGPCHCVPSQGFEQYGYAGAAVYDASTFSPSTTSNPHIISADKYRGYEYVPEAKCGGVSLVSSPPSRVGSQTGNTTSISPTSPTRLTSPRSAMMKNMFGKQALQGMSHNPSLFPAHSDSSGATLPEAANLSYSYGYLPQGLLSSSGESAISPLALGLGRDIWDALPNMPAATMQSATPKPLAQIHQSPPRPSPHVIPTPPASSPARSHFSGSVSVSASASNSALNSPTKPPSSSSALPASAMTSPPKLTIEIANGTEENTISPISPTGTMLKYTSHRPVDCGLLALKPLSESEVAEYRFWRPCGRRGCKFGCSEGNMGEVRAARRLFRSEEQVKEEEEEDDGYDEVL